MKIYLAPLEGITGYIFRNAFNGIYLQNTHCDLAVKGRSANCGEKNKEG